MDGSPENDPAPGHDPAAVDPSAAEHGTAATHEPGPEDRIQRPGSVITGIVFPVIVLIVLLVLVMTGDMSRMLDACDHYTIIQLVYPLIFAALGVIVGGSVRVSGPIVLFGNKWDGVVTGGIAAALLGFGIAAWVKPASCTPRQSLLLQDFLVSKQLNTTDGDKTVARDYFGKIDWSDTRLEVIVDNSEDNSRDLKLLFTGREKFRITLDFYRKADPTSSYQPVANCLFEVKVGKPPARRDQREFKLVPNNSRNEVALNPQFFVQLEEKLKQGPVNQPVECLTAQSLPNGDSKESPDTRTISGPLYVVAPPGWPMSLFKPLEFWFFAPVVKSEDAKASARPDATQGEPPPSNAATAPPPAETAAQPKRVVAGCNPDDTLRRDVDSYLQGYDLDHDHRTNLYDSWAGLHCYVWPLVRKSDASFSPTTRARALKLTVGAIMNAPATADQIKDYWQPQGENKRDFAKPLPYLVSADYKTVFDLVRSDDILLRGEAIRTIRYLPVDKFEALFGQQLGSVDSLSPAERERFAIAASFMYYNRIVEWLDEDDAAPTPTSALIAPDFNAAKRWITRDLLGKSVNSYDAMLLYAKGIVERERNLTADRGKSTFAAMMTAVEKMEDSYPSNFRHIAQGLAISRGGADAQSILNQVKEVDVYPAATPLTFDPPIAPQQNIYVGPADQFQKRAMTIDISQAHLLLKKGEWYLGNGLGWVGWLHRPSKSS
jgi:hypothetical protein